MGILDASRAPELCLGVWYPCLGDWGSQTVGNSVTDSCRRYTVGYMDWLVHILQGKENLENCKIEFRPHCGISTKPTEIEDNSNRAPPGLCKFKWCDVGRKDVMFIQSRLQQPSSLARLRDSGQGRGYGCLLAQARKECWRQMARTAREFVGIYETLSQGLSGKSEFCESCPFVAPQDEPLPQHLGFTLGRARGW